ncbi:cell wall endopeptidase family M23/M37 [Vibrio cholerae]|nr:cell wall endopeptidase family M23/M37 [Vibrio cholerae]
MTGPHLHYELIVRGRPVNANQMLARQESMLAAQ